MARALAGACMLTCLATLSKWQVLHQKLEMARALAHARETRCAARLFEAAAEEARCLVGSEHPWTMRIVEMCASHEDCMRSAGNASGASRQCKRSRAASEEEEA